MDRVATEEEGIADVEEVGVVEGVVVLEEEEDVLIKTNAGNFITINTETVPSRS